jgi:hypothetical protein
MKIIGFHQGYHPGFCLSFDTKEKARAAMELCSARHHVHNLEMDSWDPTEFKLVRITTSIDVIN